MKEELSKPTHTFYFCQAPTKVSADASSYYLGVVLMQVKDKQWKCVAYALRSMTDTECRYAQMDKKKPLQSHGHVKSFLSCAN